ncbi:MAG: metallophosphoesterase [Thermoprotei archaeon]|nr:MAG: metallophosphoesterase [Thermoprotei archaeon]
MIGATKASRCEPAVEYVNLLAVSDIHSPLYLPLFIASFNKVCIAQRPDVILLAGDIVNKSNVGALRPVLATFRKLGSVPIIAVFGNEEYFEDESKYISTYPEVRWLNDEYEIVEVKGVKICIIGTRGVLERPTAWQQRNVPNIRALYRERMQKIMALLVECKARTSLTILLTHYAPTYATVKGEPPSVYPYLGARIIERLDDSCRPQLAIHGHAHNAKVLKALVSGVEVYNVSLPARRGVTLIKLAVKEVE